ncbi:gp26 family baseplate hub assembly chaperone [Salmonella enterica]
MYEYKFDVRVGSKIINCRAFTLKEYLELITAKNNGSVEVIVKKLIKDCTNAKDLNRQESELLLIHLWAHSLGEVNHENSWKCTCGTEIPTHINLLHTQIDAPEDLWYTLGDIKIKFRYPKIFDDKNIAHMIVSCIETIHANGESIPVEDLNEKELEDLYSIITESDIVAIKDMLLKPTIYLAVPIKCPECGKTHAHVIRGLKEFFELL